MRGKYEKKIEHLFYPTRLPFCIGSTRVCPALLDPSAKHITESDVLLEGGKKKRRKKKIFIFYYVASQPCGIEDACAISPLQQKTAEQKEWVLSLSWAGKCR